MKNNVGKWALIFLIIFVGIWVNTFIPESNGMSYNLGFWAGEAVALIICLWDKD